MGLRQPETHETQPDRFAEPQHREYPKALNEKNESGKLVPVLDEHGNPVVFETKADEEAYAGKSKGIAKPADKPKSDKA